MKNLPVCLLTLLLLQTGISHAGDDGTIQGKSYGNNIICFAPALINNTGPGFGFSYERMLDAHQRISLYLPLGISFGPGKWHYNEEYKTRCTGGMAGLKFYPGESRGVVRYAMGISLACQVLSRSYSGYSSPGASVAYELKKRYTKFGALFNNSLQVTAGRKFVFGMELHLGVAESDEPDYDGTVPFVLLLSKIGYRF